MKIKFLFSLFIIYVLFLSQTYADVLFSEILPNTIDDTNLEYIELYNSGDAELDLSGYIIKDKGGKEYIFPNGEKLLAEEKKKYYRTKTLIILNNTDEELFLNDSFGNLVDSFYYATSVKGEEILIYEENEDIVSDEEDEEIISDEEDEEINNDIIENGEDNISDTINYTSPEIVFTFQTPTYLLNKEDVFSTYNCDTSKEECKINLDLTSSFVGDFKESDYECEIDFGFSSTEANKCNPSTIIVPLGTYNFKFKIISQDSTVFSEKSFKVVNSGYSKPISIAKVLSSITSASSSSAKKKNTGVPPIKILKPVIIVQSGLNTNNECSNKKNCSLNFKYAEKSKYEKCEWDFGGGIFKPGINTVCDPGYVDYGMGKFSVKLRVYEGGDYNNFESSEFIFSNPVGVNETQTNILQKSESINILGRNSSSGIKIYKVMPNPSGSDDLEYIELINNSDENFNLKGCKLDDILDGGSNEFEFEEDEFLGIGKRKKYQKELTGLNLNNDADEVNLICDEKILDIFKWNFEIKSGYELDHAKLDTSGGKAKVIDVIDGDTIKIQFLDSTKIENFRLIGVDTPETKHPNKEVEEYGIEAYNYVLKQLKGKEVLIELDSNNLRDTYSRLLGFVYLGDISFNKKLIELGYSKAYLEYDFKYKSDYVKAEKIAKKAELGIWANEDVVDILSEEEIDSEDEDDLDEIKDLNAKIILQGKVGKNKILKGNTLTCYDTCSINFDGKESTGDIKQYSWDFGNGQKFEGKNPGYVKYKSFGKYKVYLAVASTSGEVDIGEFNINFIKTPKKQKAAKKSKAKAKSKTGETDEDEDEETYYDDGTESEGFNYSILLYACIGVFGVVLLSIILKKEKLI